MGREHEHHVEKVRHLAERPLPAFALQRRGRLVCLLEQLRRDGRSAALKKLRRERSLGQIAAALAKERGELGEKASEGLIVGRSEAGRTAGVTGRAGGMDVSSGCVSCSGAGRVPEVRIRMAV